MGRDVAPAPGLPLPRYSIRWKGVLLVPAGGINGLVFAARDAGRVFLDGNQVIAFITVASVGYRKPVSPGTHQITIEYWNHNGGGHALLYWITADDQKEIIPAKALWHAED